MTKLFIILAISLFVVFSVSSYLVFNSRKQGFGFTVQPELDQSNLWLSDIARKQILELKKEMPDFFQDGGSTVPVYSNDGNNFFYVFSFLDTGSDSRLLKADRVFYQQSSRYTAATAIFNYNPSKRKYENVLLSSKAQAEARFPTTEVASYYPLEISFSYDAARPLECVGFTCRISTSEYYKWNSKKNTFVSSDNDHKSDFEDLYAEYEEMDKNGCAYSNIEDVPAKTLTALWKYNQTAYCGHANDQKSTRQELNKFIEAKERIRKIIQESP